MFNTAWPWGSPGGSHAVATHDNLWTSQALKDSTKQT